jgi:hypothetical protein
MDISSQTWTTPTGAAGAPPEAADAELLSLMITERAGPACWAGGLERSSCPLSSWVRWW